MPERSRGDLNESQDEQNSTDHAANLEELCHGLYDKVAAFLAEDAPSQLLRHVQQQSRISLGACEEALRRYRYVGTSHRTEDLLIAQTSRHTQRFCETGL